MKLKPRSRKNNASPPITAVSEDRKKVRWTSEEREFVAQKCFEAIVDRPQLTILQAANRAAGHLPLERRREITSFIMAPWLEEMVTNKFRTVYEQSQELAQVKVTHAAELAEQAKKIALLESDNKLLQELQPTVAEVLEKAKPTELASALSAILLGQLTNVHGAIQSINLRMTAIEDGLSKGGAPAIKVEPKPRKYRILVIGLRNEADANTIRQHLLDLADRYELSYIVADKHGKEYPTADRAFLWKKFAHSHSHFDKAKAQFGPKFKLCEAGGLGGVAQELREYLLKQPKH